MGDGAYGRRDPVTEALPSAFRYETTHNSHSLTDFCRHFLEIDGPAFTISSACSSSAKVFAAAYRFMSTGFCDAAVVGRSTVSVLTTLYGFPLLDLISANPCSPWGGARTGISIGGLRVCLLESRSPGSDIALLGYGESAMLFICPLRTLRVRALRWLLPKR